METLSNRDASADLAGGRPARILVADDNSNIQRMVALALKEHGIEVVAVGNGEAAVRSMSQALPDLILADVFMPVRSGYEVCDYVKNDSRFAHIPVVLLLGAFDPLDENEAKRVGADGVLKKPFVPPDPMIALVKALLEKSAPARLAAAPVPVAVGAGPAPFAAPEHTAPRSSRLAVETIAPPEDNPEIDFPPMGRDAFDTAAPVSASSGVRVADEPETEADVKTQQRDTALGEPSFWRPAETEQAAEAGEAAEEVEQGPHASTIAFEPVHPSPEYFTAPEENAEISAQVAEPEPQHDTLPEISAATETAAEPPGETQTEFRAEAPVEPSAAEVEQPADEPAHEWAASPNDWMAAAEAHPDAEPETAKVEAPLEHLDWTPGPLAPVAQLRGSGESPFAPSSAVWSDPVPAEATTESIASDFAAAEHWTEESHADAAVEPLSIAASSGVVEAASAPLEESFAEPAFSVEHAPLESPVAEHVAPTQEAPSVEPPASRQTTEELVNSVVARVIEKLQPQMAALINEEILRPVVSALVRLELDNKNDSARE